MHDWIINIIILCSLFILALLYFKIADKYNIVDKPNHRSSHTQVTIRGGGIIFAISAIIWSVINSLAYPFFILGLLIITVISFIDDIKNLSSGTRSIFQLIAVALMFTELSLPVEWYFYPLLFILIIGVKNAYNFMDGINGITGGYSLVTVVSLYWINAYIIHFVAESLLITVALSLIVFNYFNFRKKAKCFAGDVGSVSIAFIILYLIVLLISTSQNLVYAFLLLIYGLDTVSTIIFRIIRKEKILEAHRTHFYQYLANELRWSHLKVATLYCLTQLAANIFIIVSRKVVSFSNSITLIIVTFVLGIAFMALRLIIEGAERLTKKQ